MARQPAAAQWLIAVMLTSIRVKRKAHKAFEPPCFSVFNLMHQILHSPNIKLISQQNYQIYMAIIPCKWPLNTNFAALVTCWDWCIHWQLLDPLNPHGGTASSKIQAQMNQHVLAHPYRASSCSGTPTQKPEERWRSPPLSSPPTRTTACHWQQ